MFESIKDLGAKLKNKDEKQFVIQFLRVCAGFIGNMYAPDKVKDDKSELPKFLKKSINTLNGSDDGLKQELITKLKQNAENFKQQKQDEFNILIDQTGNLDFPQTDKPQLLIQFGDYRSVFKELHHKSPYAMILSQNAGNPYHPGGIVAYGGGSAEEALLRETNGFLEFVLYHLKGKRQIDALAALFEAMVYIIENGEEAFLNNTDNSYNKYLDKMIAAVFRDEVENYYIDNVSDDEEARRHITVQYMVGQIDQPIENYQANEFNTPFQQAQSIIVISTAAPDDRLFFGTESFMTALTRSDIKAKDTLVTLFKDACKYALEIATENQNIPVYLDLLAIGAGAFKIKSNIVAEAAAEALKGYEPVFRQLKNLKTIFSVFPDTYPVVTKTFQQELGETYDIISHAVTYDVRTGESMGMIPEAMLVKPSNPEPQPDEEVPIPLQNNLTVSMANVDLTQHMDVDALVLSSNENILPNLNTNSLIARLCNASGDFKTACKQAEKVEFGDNAKFKDVSFSFKNEGKTYTTDVYVAAVPDITLKLFTGQWNNPNKFKYSKMVEAYVNTLMQIQKNAESEGKNNLNVGLTLFGTGNMGWKGHEVAEIAGRVINKLTKDGQLDRIAHIELISRDINFKTLSSFQRVITYTSENGNDPAIRVESSLIDYHNDNSKLNIDTIIDETVGQFLKPVPADANKKDITKSMSLSRSSEKQ